MKADTLKTMMSQAWDTDALTEGLEKILAGEAQLPEDMSDLEVHRLSCPVHSSCVRKVWELSWGPVFNMLTLRMHSGSTWLYLLFGICVEELESQLKRITIVDASASAEVQTLKDFFSAHSTGVIFLQNHFTCNGHVA